MNENTTPAADAATDSINETSNTPSPSAEALTDDVLFGCVAEIIEEVRPFIQSDGGDIELLKVEDNVVYVALTGACIGCPSSMVTLKHGVEARIREELPQVESVEMV